VTIRSKRTFAVVGSGLAVVLACGAVSVPAQAAPADTGMFCQNPADPSQNLEIAPIDSLQAGDALTWKTTIAGTDVRTFDAEYVTKVDAGLGHDANGEAIDLLLVDLDNPDPELKKIGAWAGASGSPVYDLQGRLVGAVAYGFTERGESVAGVTPAAAMKRLGSLPGGVKLSTSAQRSVERATGEVPGVALKRIKNVLVRNGMGQERLGEMEKQLRRAFPGYRLPGFLGVSQSQRVAGLPINGGAGAGDDIPVVPGGNVAVSYAYGYLAEASVGTVTAVCGDEVWAYGHPGGFDRSQGASIHGAAAARIVADGGLSYKQISKIGRAQGKVVADGLVGVKSKLGHGAPTVPVVSTSRIGSHSSTATTHVSSDDLIAPAAGVQLANDAVRMLDNAEVGSAAVDWQIEFTRGGKRGALKNSNRYSADSLFPTELGLDVAADIAALQQNEFERLKITAVKLSARYSPEHLVERLTGVQIRKNGAWKHLRNGGSTKVKRGKTYRFRAVLRTTTTSDRDVTEYVQFSVVIPKNQKRTMSVKLDASSAGDPMENLLEILKEMGISGPAVFGPSTFDEFLSMLDHNARNDQVRMSAAYRNQLGAKRIRERVLNGTRVVSGGAFSFVLEAPKLKKPKAERKQDDGRRS